MNSEKPEIDRYPPLEGGIQAMEKKKYIKEVKAGNMYVHCIQTELWRTC